MSDQRRRRRQASALELPGLAVAPEGSQQAAPLRSRTEPENIKRRRNAGPIFVFASGTEHRNDWTNAYPIKRCFLSVKSRRQMAPDGSMAVLTLFARSRLWFLFRFRTTRQIKRETDKGDRGRYVKQIERTFSLDRECIFENLHDQND